MIEIREAQDKDAAQVYDVMLDCYYIGAFFPETPRDEVERIIREDFFVKRTFLVAVEEAKVVGYMMFKALEGDTDQFPQDAITKLPPAKECAYSKGTGILSSSRRKGYASQLKLAADTKAKEQGFKHFVTDVLTQNTASVANQLSNGFKEVTRFTEKSGRERIFYLKTY